MNLAEIVFPGAKTTAGVKRVADIHYSELDQMVIIQERCRCLYAVALDGEALDLLITHLQTLRTRIGDE